MAVIFYFWLTPVSNNIFLELTRRKAVKRRSRWCKPPHDMKQRMDVDRGRVTRNSTAAKAAGRRSTLGDARDEPLELDGVVSLEVTRKCLDSVLYLFKFPLLYCTPIIPNISQYCTRSQNILLPISRLLIFYLSRKPLVFVNSHTRGGQHHNGDLPRRM